MTIPTPVPQTIRVCTTADGVNIAYATAGKGAPLLFTPSWFTHLQFNWESAVWRHWNTAFARGRTLVRFDPRGNRERLVHHRKDRAQLHHAYLFQTGHQHRGEAIVRARNAGLGNG